MATTIPRAPPKPMAHISLTNAANHGTSQSLLLGAASPKEEDISTVSKMVSIHSTVNTSRDALKALEAEMLARLDAMLKNQEEEEEYESLGHPIS